jgi:hypothetical protein
MATHSRTTFQKRQKELARLEKRRDKAARKAQRKLAPPEPDIMELDPETGLPIERPEAPEEGESPDAGAQGQSSTNQ